jgi:hypothetical protein
LASISLDPVNHKPHRKISLFSAGKDAEVQLVFDGNSESPNPKTSWVSVNDGRDPGPEDVVSLEELGPAYLEVLNGNAPGTEGSQGYLHYKGGGSLRYQWPEAVFIWGDPALKPEEGGVKSLNLFTVIQ